LAAKKVLKARGAGDKKFIPRVEFLSPLPWRRVAGSDNLAPMRLCPSFEDCSFESFVDIAENTKIYGKYL